MDNVVVSADTGRFAANGDPGVSRQNPASTGGSLLQNTWRSIAGGVRRVSRELNTIKLLNSEGNNPERGDATVTYRRRHEATGTVPDVADGKAPGDPVKECHRQKKKLIAQYSIHDDTHVGVGSSTGNQSVVEVRDRWTNVFYVAKPIRGGEPKDREIKFLQMLKEDNNKYIANLIAVTDEHIIMEDGGINLKKMVEVTGAPANELVGQSIAQLVKALCYLSEKGIVHGDIKPDNLLLHNRQLKICDFGIARQKGEKYRGATPVSYTPLECFKDGEYEHMDIWSAGCVWYFLITGQNLFPRDCVMGAGGVLIATGQAMQARIDKASEVIEKRLGADAKDLFEKMMVLTSGNRITPEKAVQHSYIKAAEQSLVNFPLVQDSLQENAVPVGNTAKCVPLLVLIGGRDRDDGYIRFTELRRAAGIEMEKFGSACDNPEYWVESRLLSPRLYENSEYINVSTC